MSQSFLKINSYRRRCIHLTRTDLLEQIIQRIPFFFFILPFDVRYYKGIQDTAFQKRLLKYPMGSISFTCNSTHKTSLETVVSVLVKICMC